MTIEIQAPYRLLLAKSPQQVMALQTYIQAAYTLEFTPASPIFSPVCWGYIGRTGRWSVPVVSIMPVRGLSIWNSIWSNPSRPPSTPASGSTQHAIGLSKWAIWPAANQAMPA